MVVVVGVVAKDYTYIYIILYCHINNYVVIMDVPLGKVQLARRRAVNALQQRTAQLQGNMILALFLDSTTACILTLSNSRLLHTLNIDLGFKARDIFISQDAHQLVCTSYEEQLYVYSLRGSPPRATLLCSVPLDESERIKSCTWTCINDIIYLVCAVSTGILYINTTTGVRFVEKAKDVKYVHGVDVSALIVLTAGIGELRATMRMHVGCTPFEVITSASEPTGLDSNIGNLLLCSSKSLVVGIKDDSALDIEKLAGSRRVGFSHILYLLIPIYNYCIA